MSVGAVREALAERGVELREVLVGRGGATAVVGGMAGVAGGEPVGDRVDDGLHPHRVDPDVRVGPGRRRLGETAVGRLHVDERGEVEQRALRCLRGGLVHGGLEPVQVDDDGCVLEGADLARGQLDVMRLGA